jgi:hypothetical protein
MFKEKYEVEDGKRIPPRGKGHAGTIYDNARQEFEHIYKSLARTGHFKPRGEKKKFAKRILDKYPDIEKERTVYTWMLAWDAELLADRHLK